MSLCAESLKRASVFVHTAACGPTTPLSHQIEALFGLFVAERAGVPGAGGYVDAMAARVKRSLDSERRSGRFEPFTFDAKLLLICHTALRERNLECEALTTFAKDVSAALREMAVIPLRLAARCNSWNLWAKSRLALPVELSR